jgi:hypothetical protein
MKVTLNYTFPPEVLEVVLANESHCPLGATVSRGSNTLASSMTGNMPISSSACWINSSTCPASIKLSILSKSSLSVTICSRVEAIDAAL